MVTQVYGEGRTFFTALDSSWRWRYLHGDRYFYRFWGQVIRYISMYKLLGGNRQYYLRVDNNQYTIGEKVKITLKIRSADKKRKITDSELEILYLVPGGEEKTRKLVSDEDNPGSFKGSLITTRIGNHKIKFRPDKGKDITVFFNVIAPVAESGNTELNEKDLKKLAKNTQGKFIKPYQLEDTLNNMVPKKELIHDTEREYPYWDQSWILIIFFIIFSLEWLMRKIFRMM